MNINSAVDYIISESTETGQSLNHLKLQKLLYYCQAWSLAFDDCELFPGETFQAWVHGPVNRNVYNRFLGKVGMYDPLNNDFIQEPPTERHFLIDTVLEAYSPFTAIQLEELTHSEAPWQNARRGLRAYERSETIISNSDMAEFYKSKIA